MSSLEKTKSFNCAIVFGVALLEIWHKPQYLNRSTLRRLTQKEPTLPTVQNTCQTTWMVNMAQECGRVESMDRVV